MTKVDVFLQNNYRDLIKNVLLAKKERFRQRFNFQKLATHCRVQKTYLSKVLNGDGHLNSDQIYLAADFLKLNQEEANYLGLLHESERSVVGARKIELQAKLEKLRQKKLSSTQYLKGQRNESQESLLYNYYLDASMQLVHMFLTVPRYARDVGKIKTQLSLSGERLEEILSNLLELGYISFEKGRYRVEKDILHLPAESPIWSSYKILMRVKALEKIQESSSAYNFSVVYSADSDARDQIQEKFLQFLKEAQAIALAAPKESIYQMNFDLFGWSD